MNEPQIYPLLPLRGMMIFPYMIINFDVGRARSLAAVELANRKDKKIFLLAQRDENTQSPEMSDLYEMGTVAEIKQVMRLPNGGARVIVEGVGKARLLQLNHEADFDLVAVQPEKDTGVNDSQELTALVRAVVHKFEEWVKLSKQLPAEALISVAITDDLPRMADVISGHLNLKLDQKQELLAELDLPKRLEKIFDHLQREIEIQSIEQDIETKFRARVEKVQKDFYLREKIKAIHEELGDDISRDSENQRLKDRLAAGDYPEAVREVIEKEIKNAQAPSAYGIELTDEKSMLSGLIKVNTQTGAIIKSSPVTFIRNRTIFQSADGFVAIAGENVKNGAVKLVLLSPDTMEIVKESDEIVNENSVLVQDSGEYYCVVKNDSSWVLAKYGSDLSLKLKSSASLKSSTPVTVADSFIIVTAANGSVCLLNKTDLSPVNGSPASSSSYNGSAK